MKAGIRVLVVEGVGVQDFWGYRGLGVEGFEGFKGLGV